jgi:hypothetical protein
MPGHPKRKRQGRFLHGEAVAGVSIRSIMNQTGHRGVAMVHRYSVPVIGTQPDTVSARRTRLI